MFDMMRRLLRTSKTAATAALGTVLLAAAGAAAALLGWQGPATAILILLLGAVAAGLAAINLKLRQKVILQHRHHMRYSIKAEQRLRDLYAKLDWMNRLVDQRIADIGEEVSSANRRVLASVESERYEAAVRHAQICDALKRLDQR